MDVSAYGMHRRRLGRRVEFVARECSKYALASVSANGEGIGVTCVHTQQVCTGVNSGARGRFE